MQKTLLWLVVVEGGGGGTEDRLGLTVEDWQNTSAAASKQRIWHAAGLPEVLSKLALLPKSVRRIVVGGGVEDRSVVQIEKSPDRSFRLTA